MKEVMREGIVNTMRASWPGRCYFSGREWAWFFWKRMDVWRAFYFFNL